MPPIGSAGTFSTRDDHRVSKTLLDTMNILGDPRVKIYEVGGDICQTDILNAALKDADGVFHFAALWLLQCHDYPRAAFDVNVHLTASLVD